MAKLIVSFRYRVKIQEGQAEETARSSGCNAIGDDGGRVVAYEAQQGEVRNVFLLT